MRCFRLILHGTSLYVLLTSPYVTPIQIQYSLDLITCHFYKKYVLIKGVFTVAYLTVNFNSGILASQEESIIRGVFEEMAYLLRSGQHFVNRQLVGQARCVHLAVHRLRMVAPLLWAACGVRREAEAGAFRALERRSERLEVMLPNVPGQVPPLVEVGHANETGRSPRSFLLGRLGSS